MIKKHIMLETLFYNEGQHCRRIPPNLNRYRPHLVIKGHKEYLGIQFIEGEDVILGKKAIGIAECLYEEKNYDELKIGIEFFVMEGRNKVGEGKIIG